MTWQDLQEQALNLSIGDRRLLVKSLLTSIEQETLPTPSTSSPLTQASSALDPWTQSLIGVIQLENDDLEKDYVDYLEKKYS